MNVLELHPFRRQDLEAVEPWFADPETARRLGDREWPREALRLPSVVVGQTFEGVTTVARQAFFAVDHQEGGVGLVDIEVYDNRSASFAFVVAPQLRRRGWGHAILRHIEDLGILREVHTLIGDVDADNDASIHCLRKAGYAVAEEPDEHGMLAVCKPRRASTMVPVAALAIPRNLARAAANADDSRRLWLESLPSKVDAIAQQWSLEVGEPFQPGGQTAWVAPACTASGVDVVLKVGWRHDEALHEADALREWNGDGAIQLFDVAEFDDTIALLVERCVPDSSLASRPEAQQDVVVAGLLRRLWRVPTTGHRFRPLHLMCDTWADEFEQRKAVSTTNIDNGLARDGIALFRTLPRTADREVLLCTDLHAENVLGAEREPWLVIDPKPYVGDPAYDALQHMLNCRGRLLANPVGVVNRMAELLELGSERLRLWLFARCVQESHVWPDLVQVARMIEPS